MERAETSPALRKGGPFTANYVTELHTDPFFNSGRERLIALAVQYRLPRSTNGVNSPLTAV